VFATVDALDSPRLVEYWEQDPCASTGTGNGFGGLSGIGMGGGGRGEGIGLGSIGSTVQILAQFEVGEYEIVILSAKDSGGLDTWLRANGYKIPAGAEPALRPYVAAGSKFFVAKVNVSKVTMEDGRAALSPLRFHYDSDKFELPVKLGTLNSGGAQDLVVHILAPHQRYVVANYPNATIPTNLDVPDTTKSSFGTFYRDLFDKTIASSPSTVLTEYSWGAGSCDPCPGNVQGLAMGDLATLGADVLPSAKMGPAPAAGPSIRQAPIKVSKGLPPEVVQRIMRQNFGRFRLCYEQGLRKNPNLAGRVGIDFQINAAGAVASAAKTTGSDLPDPAVLTCVASTIPKLSFPAPEAASIVDVSTAIVFAPPANATATVLRSIAPDFVLTRLHTRYKKTGLAADLVFKAAPPIVGGREIRNPDGSIERGAKEVKAHAPNTGGGGGGGGLGLSGLGGGGSSDNNFQARFVIRHAWKDPIACKKPQRGVWGGPWPGVTESGDPIAATNPAFAIRANALGTPAADAGAPPSPAIEDAGATPPPPPSDASPEPPRVPPATPSGCGCETFGVGSSNAALLLGTGLIALAAIRRRRPSL
jgi:hypothetical protein